VDAALGWLGTVFESLLTLFPRLVIVRSTHQGIKWRGGKKPVRLAPGVHAYWPLVSEVELRVVARQTVNLVTQVLMTKDKQSAVVGGFVVYSIDDIVRAMGEKNWDVDDTLTNIAMAAIVEVVTSHTLDELLSGISEGRNSTVHRKLTLTCRKQLKQFGVAIQRAGITDFSQTRVYRLVGNMEGI
jgi:regulator of protease activity HflC (stomatin/prohibitin superfamily)